VKEDLLQYLWHTQQFDKTQLTTQEGQPLNIIQTGYWNQASGPDFLQAQIRIGNIVWFGAVEIHLNTSDWDHHAHQHDAAYNQVILHVAWRSSHPVYRQDGTIIPTLLLAERVSQHLLEKYHTMHSSAHRSQLACRPYVHSIPAISKVSALERAAIQRVERKTQEILGAHPALKQQWPQSALRTLSQAFGFKANAPAFATLGSRLDYRMVLRESNSMIMLLAILLLSSGLQGQLMLNMDTRQKSILLHLSKKYRLMDKAMQKHEFCWSPLRPPNMPHIRLTQLAALLHHQPDSLGFLLYPNELQEYIHYFEQANQTLLQHKHQLASIFRMGKQSMYSIVINAVVPFRYAYGKHQADERLMEQALMLLQQIPAEKNKLTQLFESHHFTLGAAFETQGVLEQHQFYCSAHRCLQCPVGVAVMNNHELVAKSSS